MNAAFGLCIQEAYLVMMLMQELTDNFNFLFCLASSGCGVGMVLPPLVAEVLRTTYGWRDALLILGALMINIVPCIQCIRPRHNNHGNGDATDNGNHQTQNNDRGTVNVKYTKVRCKELSPTKTRSNLDDETLKYHGESRTKLANRLMYRDEPCSSDKREEATSSTIPCNKGDHRTMEPFAHLDHTRNDVIGGSEGCDEEGCSYLGNYDAACRNVYYDDIPSENDGSSSCEESSVSLLSRTSVADVTRDRRSLSRSKIHALPAGNQNAMDRQDCNDLRLCEGDDDDCDDDRYDKTSTRKTTSAKEKKRKQSEQKFAEKIFDIIHAFRTTPFYTDVWGNFIYVVSLVYGIVYGGWHAFLVPHALERGITPYYVLIITTFAALGNFSGRVSAGILTNSLVSPASLFLMLCPVDSLLLLGYAYVDNEIAMAVLSCLSAVSIAVRAKLPLLVAKERTSADMYQFVYGAFEMSVGVGSLLGGLMPGKYLNASIFMFHFVNLILKVIIITIRRFCFLIMAF